MAVRAGGRDDFRPLSGSGHRQARTPRNAQRNPEAIDDICGRKIHEVE